MESNEKYIDELLSNLNWDKVWSEIDMQHNYNRKEDDSPDGFLSVCLGIDGDMHLSVINSQQERFRRSIRFRECSSGGGRSSRVRKALLLLCMAIKAENEDDPYGAKND